MNLTKALKTAKANIKDVMAFVEVTEPEYMRMLLGSGVDYAYTLGLDSSEILVLLNSQAYWNWYANQFNILDVAFVELGEVPELPDFLTYSLVKGVWRVSKLEAWRIFHKPTFIKAYPSESVREQAYQEFKQHPVNDLLDALISNQPNK